MAFKEEFELSPLLFQNKSEQVYTCTALIDCLQVKRKQYVKCPEPCNKIQDVG